ncbi:MAG: ATP-binding protein, partial [Planctomycetota bacterium]
CVQDELYEVVNNLAINAVEACSGGGHIHFQLTTKQDDCVLEVCDDGVGMSPDVQARAFHPFFSTKPREGGLGLAMVRKTVVSSGGWIELESQPGAGTTFRIGMPLAPQMKRATTKAVT